MQFLAVAIDYDGTLATRGTVQPRTLAAIERLLASGRKLILVTGRILDDLLTVFPEAGLCTSIVAENGAVLYQPATREKTLLCAPPPEAFIDALKRKTVTPLEVGEAIIATLRPHEQATLEAIRDLGLEYQVIFNRESVMVLPSGVNKGTGLRTALKVLRLSPHNVVAVGDSENDHALLRAGECGVAVGNAVPMLKAIADRITNGESGDGSAEIMEELVHDDFAAFAQTWSRHTVLLGSREDGSAVSLSPTRDNVLIAGASASGKSTLATGLLERLTDQGYQTCVIDPEGDYELFDRAIVFGHAQRGPTVAEIMTAIENPDAQIVVNLIGLSLQDRPSFFQELWAQLVEYRMKMGRPHRILIDEAHHLLPVSGPTDALRSVDTMNGMTFVTVHPEQVATSVLRRIDVAIALGEAADATLQAFAGQTGHKILQTQGPSLRTGEALIWGGPDLDGPARFLVEPCKGERRRHQRKYAEGELPPERSFYFRGADGHLNLRAQNLTWFRQLAAGVDDETWMHHLRQGDYSHWIGQVLKDPSLAKVVQEVEQDLSITAQASRRRVTDAIEERYTLPATGT
jgi:hydroxymethylpyrimidine pyrophosphatase-like HAD family hydrolase